MTQIGEALREARLDRDWTQQVLADKAGVSRVQVSRIERGSDFKHSTVRRLADALDVSVGTLIEGGSE